MSGAGHNGGPTMEPGFGFRKLAWTRARAQLLPRLPLEVVRLRVARAERLGLPYRTYATIRATSGMDIVGFLFSSNALELTRARLVMPAEVAVRLAPLAGAVDRVAAVHVPLHPGAVMQANPGLVDAAGMAPGFTARWRETRAGLRRLLRDRKLPLDGVVVVAATAMEREWCATAGLAGVIAADAMFWPA